MKAIILAAGTGSRLKEFTKDIPKCMVNIAGRSLITYQLEILKSCNINDINIVAGYKYEEIPKKDINLFINENYASTNMVYTLFCAREILCSNDDILLSYGDIIYTKRLLQNIANKNFEINVAVDTLWKNYWESRMQNPLEDAETLKLDSKKNILEIGKKTNSFKDIQAQYIGLIKIRSDIAKKLFDIYQELDHEAFYDGKTYNQMYMTTFIQQLINIGIEVKAIPFKRDWVEIDTRSDITIAENWIKKTNIDGYKF